MATIELHKLKEIDELSVAASAHRKSEISAAITDFRRTGLERFKSLGLPSQKQEEWRFLNLSALASLPLAVPAPGADAGSVLETIKEQGLLELSPAYAVFVDGYYRDDLSSLAGLPSGVRVYEAAASDPAVEEFFGTVATDAQHPFVAINDAFFSDLLVIHTAAGTISEDILQVLYVTTESKDAVITNPRLLIVSEPQSQVTILETFVGPEGMSYFTNSVTEIVAKDNAVVDHYRLNLEGKEAFHIASLESRLGRSSNCSTQSVTFGSRLTRNDVGMHMDGEGGFGVMNGLYQIGGDQFVDNHTRIDHAFPNCETHELYKGVLHGHSRGVFNGRIMVRQIAQKTNSKQTNRTLILSSDALMNSNPQLEIFADDVKCTHGATIGQIDQTQLYYLRSRGISDSEARRMLVFAFANDVLERIKPAALRELLENKLLAAQEAKVALAGT